MENFPGFTTLIILKEIHMDLERQNNKLDNFNDWIILERLARRVEQHSQRMAELLRRGVLEPSLAYAFLMTN